MRQGTEMCYLRDLTRVVHFRKGKCVWIRRDSTITDNEYLVSCKHCLKKRKKTFNKVLFLELLKTSSIVKEGLISVVRVNG
jgi:hypothetical protein